MDIEINWPIFWAIVLAIGAYRLLDALILYMVSIDRHFSGMSTEDFDYVNRLLSGIAPAVLAGLAFLYFKFF